MNLDQWEVFKNVQGIQPHVKLALTVGCIVDSLERFAGVMVMKDDQVYSIGVNVDGCLGVPGISSTKAPVKIQTLCDKQVEELAAGYAHVVALTKSGQVYTWGQNHFYQLGLSAASHPQRAYCTPNIVTGLNGHVVTKIACGFNHTLALTKEGIVFGWGYNKGLRICPRDDPKDFYDNVVDIPIEIRFSVSTNVKIVAIACGRQFSVALTNTGKVYCWGSNSHGQLGLSLETPYCGIPLVVETEHPFEQIACGAYHVVGLTISGRCYTWGQKGGMAVTTPMRTGENLSGITEIGATYLARASALVASDGVYVWGQLKENIDPIVKMDYVHLTEFLPMPYLTECSSIDEVFNKWPSPAVMFRCFRPRIPPSFQNTWFRFGYSSWMVRMQTNQPPLGSLESLENSPRMFESVGDPNAVSGIKVIPHWKVPLANAAGETEILGEGNSGIVYKAVYKKKQVAVKRMRSSSSEWMKTMVRELKALAAIGNHKNIVKLVGIVRPPASYLPELEDMLIVTEYCELGDMKSFLSKWKPYFRNQVRDGQIVLCGNITTEPKAVISPYVKTEDTNLAITTVDLVRWSIQFALGMAYLASKNIVHGDVALRNLLLTAKKVVKVSDFGLSRPILGSDYYKFDVKALFPWTSAAPETFDDRKISTASDVWGFGITLWEMFTLGQVPYKESFNEFSEQFKNAIRGGHRLGCPEFATEHLYNVMASCWHLNPECRNTFEELLQTLSTIVD